MMAMATAGVNAVELPFTVTPADGSTVETLDVITFTVNEDQELFQVNPYGFYFTKNGEEFCEAVVDEDYYDVMNVSPATPITEPGTYQLVIGEEDMVVWSKSFSMYYNSEPLVFTYIVENGGAVENDYPFTIDPAPGSTVDAIEKITFALTEEGGYDVFMTDFTGFHFTKDGEEFCECSIEENYDVIYVVPEKAIEETGTYELVIDPESLVAWSMSLGMYYNSKPLVFSYTVSEGSSIATIVVDTNVINGVFNLQGVKVAGSMDSVPAGIYVVNGKKVLKK